MLTLSERLAGAARASLETGGDALASGSGCSDGAVARRCRDCSGGRDSRAGPAPPTDSLLSGLTGRRRPAGRLARTLKRHGVPMEPASFHGVLAAASRLRPSARATRRRAGASECTGSCRRSSRRARLGWSRTAGVARVKSRTMAQLEMVIDAGDDETLAPEGA